MTNGLNLPHNHGKKTKRSPENTLRFVIFRHFFANTLGICSNGLNLPQNHGKKQKIT